MNWNLLIFAFGFGTFKFVFVHWTTYIAFGEPNFNILWQIFVGTTLGAWVTMTVFYYMSEYFMKRARQKRLDKIQKALDSGVPLKTKKNFTRLNKLIVWIKQHIGIYGVTVLAPLFLSIPIGSIVCAKFYGRYKKTFPLMLLFTASYSALMCFTIYLVYF